MKILKSLSERIAEVDAGLESELGKLPNRGSEEFNCRAHALRREAEDTKSLICITYKPDGTLTTFGQSFLSGSAAA